MLGWPGAAALCILGAVWSHTACGETPQPPFAWQSPKWDLVHPRLVNLLHDQDYQGLHGVPLPGQHKSEGAGAFFGSGERKLKRPLLYHLVLTSCDRPHWGRHLVTTLLSIWLQQAQPLTLTVMWCRPYNATAVMPSLFYNLRYSSQFRLLHVPPTQVSGMKVQPSTTYWWGLTVPDYYNRPEIPLLLMEDDAVLHPHFASVLASAARAIEVKYGPPYMLNVYVPGDIASAHLLLDPSVYNDTTRPAFASSSASASLERKPGVPLYGRMFQGGIHAWSWGVQAQLYSADMRAELTRHYWEMVTGAYISEDKRVGWQDMIVFDYVYKRRQDTRRVAVFGIRPSLVEHTGASSAVFGGVSTRFHRSQDYPFFVRMPMQDSDMDW